MDIKYKVSKLKDNNSNEIKDSVSVEEPLEMSLRFKVNESGFRYIRFEDNLNQPRIRAIGFRVLKTQLLT